MQGVAVWQQEQYLGPLDGCLIEGRHLKGDGSRAVDVPRSSVCTRRAAVRRLKKKGSD